MKSIICLSIVFITAVLSAKIIQYQAEREYPTASYSFVPVHKTPVVQPENQESLDSEIKRLSKKYEVDENLVREIGKCESELYPEAVHENKRQRMVGYDENKEPIYESYVWSRDFGFLQVNDFYHEADMYAIGLDIHNWKESLEYGVLLLSRDGTRHWEASQFCWGN